jgi:hypothetical protein
MRTNKFVPLCSMIVLAAATMSGASAQQVVQVARTEVVTPSAILTPGDHLVLMTTTHSAVIPNTNPTADIHTPSLLPPGTQMVHSISGCDTAIILPGMADMPSAQVATVAQTNSAAAVVEEKVAPAPQIKMLKETTTTTTTTKVYRQVRATKKIVRRAPAKRAYRPAAQEILK